MLPAQPNQSLIDGLEVLLGAVDAAEPVGVRELARRLGLETTRTQRLLGTLAHLGLLHRTDNGRYGPGTGLHVLAAAATAANGLLAKALPELDRLQRATKMTVALGSLWRDRVVYLAVFAKDRDPLTAVGASRSYPIQRSSIGVLLLGWQEPGYAAAHGIAPALETQGASARRRGWSLIDQPTEQTRSLAVPIGDPPRLAIGLSGSFSDARIADLRDQATAVAARLASQDIP
ncbi:global regulatory protein [Planctomycetota bacterium]|nr:global regulatory protein [Planctomycetota bacterium]